jgi:hypothetical protein
VVKRERKKEEEKQFVEFRGLNLFRGEVLKTNEGRDNFLNHKDFLHLKFIKYPNPFGNRSKNNRQRRSLRRPIESKHHSYAFHEEESHFETNPIEQSTQLLTNFATAFNMRSKVRFKEAALPIKELKRRIRTNSEFDGKICFHKVKEGF